MPLADKIALIGKYMPSILLSCVIVIQLTVFTILISWVFGLFAGLGKASKYRLLNGPCRFYIWFIRGTPTLIQVYVIYFGLPQFGIQLSPFTAGVLALGVNSGAYVAEIFRSGLSAIPRGQMESARALGMTYVQAMRRIILPQVIRIILPAITNEGITMLKNTSLLSTITVLELTLQTQVVIARTFRPFEFYIVASILYLIMTTVLSHYSDKMEKKYALSM